MIFYDLGGQQSSYSMNMYLTQWMIAYHGYAEKGPCKNTEQLMKISIFIIFLELNMICFAKDYIYYWGNYATSNDEDVISFCCLPLK